MLSIPFNRPSFIGDERAFIEEALTQMHLSADGGFSRRVHEKLERLVGSHRALVTTSCTDALEMSAILLGVGPGDEVVVPTFTFVSTANAFVMRGATPRFIDSRDDTHNLDESLLEAAVTERTKAICVVHYAGIACEMDEILEFGAARGIPIVEDNAHGLFGSYRGRPLGSLGALAALSFHETKNISCGEGGALCVNDPRLIERAEIIRSKGTNRARFLRGEVDKYTWVDIGSSFGLSDLCAAVLLAQLEVHDAIQARRTRLWRRYAELLPQVLAGYPARLPTIPSGVESAYHMYQLILPDEIERDAFLDHCRAARVLSVFHYVPLHTSEMGSRFGYRVGDYPVAERNAARLARLPFFTTMSDEEQNRVIEVVGAFARSRTGR